MLNNGHWFTDKIHEKTNVWSFLLKKYPKIDWEQRFENGYIVLNETVVTSKDEMGKKGVCLCVKE